MKKSIAVSKKLLNTLFAALGLLLFIPSSYSHAQTLSPVDLQKARGLQSRFLDRSLGYGFRVVLEGFLVEGTQVEVSGRIEAARGSQRIDFKTRKAIDQNHIDFVQVVESESRGACSYAREEKLHLRLHVLNNQTAKVIGATLYVGETSDRCHESFNDISADFRPDPRALCEDLLPLAFTLDVNGQELRGFQGNLKERTHPQSSVLEPASLITESPSLRTYFIPSKGSALPRDGALYSCNLESGEIRILAGGADLQCKSIPAAVRLESVWMDCR